MKPHHTMARFSDRQLPKSIRDVIWKDFCNVVAKLKNEENVRRFLSDLLNRQERLMLARRLQIAALLDAGFTYKEIRKILGVGKPTIARVQRWLNFGRDGYRRAARLIEAKDRRRLKELYDRYYRS